MSKPSHNELDERFDRLLDELPVLHDPPAGVRGRLETRLRERLPRATGPWWQRLPGPPLLAVPRPNLVRLLAVPLILAVLLTAAFTASPAARAQLLRFACYVPGFGIQTCDRQGLIAAQVASATHDGTTATVVQVLSTVGETTVRLEISRPSGMGDAMGKTAVALRDDRGHAYAPTRRFGYSSDATSSPVTYHLEIPFPALDPTVRVVEVQVDGPSPIGDVTVPVPVVPVQVAGLPAAQTGVAAATRHGVTVRVGSVFANGRQTEVQLVAAAPASEGSVAGLAGWGGVPGGGNRPIRPITLTDDRGQTYAEIPSPANPHPTGTAGPAGYADDVVFPPLPPGVQAASLTLPYVVLSQDSGELQVTVPVAGVGFNQPIPVHADRTLGPYPVRVTGAYVNPNGCDLPASPTRPTTSCQPMLMLKLDLGGWRNGRKLLLVRPALVDGRSAGIYMGRSDPADDIQHWTEVGAPLPAQHGDQVTITFRAALVAIQGPWQLQVPARRAAPGAGR